MNYRITCSSIIFIFAGSPIHSPILFHSQIDELITECHEKEGIVAQIKNSVDDEPLENTVKVDSESSAVEPVNCKETSAVDAQIESQLEDLSNIAKNASDVTCEEQETNSSAPETTENSEHSPSRPTDSMPFSPEQSSPKASSDSQTSEQSTADIVRCALETLHGKGRVVVESYQDHCSVEVTLEQCPEDAAEESKDCEESNVDGEVQDDSEEEGVIIEDLLTPLEESLSLPSSSESLVVAVEMNEKRENKKHKGKSKHKS